MIDPKLPILRITMDGIDFGITDIHKINTQTSETNK